MMSPRNIVLALGIAWLGIGGMSVGAGVFGLVQSLIWQVPVDDLPVQFPLLDVFMRYRPAITAGQIVFGLIIIVCAAFFLRKYRWARYALQVFSFLNIVWGAVFGSSWVQGVRNMTATVDSPVFAYVGIGMIGFGIAAMLAITAMWVGCIWLLSRPQIGAEFTR